MATLFNPFFRGIDASSNVLAAAKLYFYSAGTSTPASTYSDAALSAVNANPVVADSGGLFGAIYLDATTTYKAILKDSSDNTIQTLDPITSLNPSSISGLVTGAAVSSVLTNAMITAALGYTPASVSVGAAAATTFLTSAVALNATASYFNGPNTGAIGLSGQIWLLQAKAALYDSAGGAVFYLQIHDGSNAVDDAVGITSSSSESIALTTSRVVTLTAATTFTVKARDATSINGIMQASNDGGTTNHATSITSIRLK